MDGMTLFGIISTLLGVIRATPQPVGLLRTRHACGVSGDTAATSMIVSSGWAVYGILTHQPVITLASGASGIIFALITLSAIRYGRQLWELKTAPVWLAVTRRSRGISLLQVVKELNTYLRGWLGYFRLIETPTIIRDLDSWIRRRLRCFMMKQWDKNCHNRFQRLRSLGVSAQGACGVAGSRKGPWALSNAKPVKVALPNRFFAEKGLLFLFDLYETK